MANTKKSTKEKATEEKTVEKPKTKLAKDNVKTWQSISLVLLIIAIAAVMLSGGSKPATCDVSNQPAPQEDVPADSGTSLTSDEASSLAIDFIDNYLLDSGMSATLDSVKEANGLYELTVSVSGQSSVVYVSLDGKILFLSGIDMVETAKEIDAQAAQPTGTTPEPSADVPKSDKPEVEVFVMSYCPYGTQMEKGILPVIATLGDTADIQIKFVDYAMHGEKEVYENLRQYCIQKDFSDKYSDYLGCFLGDGDSEACLTETGISTTELQTCMDSADEEFDVTTLFDDKSSWKGNYPPFMIDGAKNEEYGVRGSPTLVINGKTVSSGRDSQSLLTNICAAFNTAPEQCNIDLSSEPSPAPGFGYTAGNSGTTASCG